MIISSFLHILLVFGIATLGSPVFGSTMFNGRQSGVRRSNTNNYSWNQYPQFLNSQRLPLNYYEMYPYNPDNQNRYYYSRQEAPSYPVYIPAPRTSKYEVYQAVLPYYYDNQPEALTRQNYGYYDYRKSSDPVRNLEDEMLQEAEREEREEAQPIGQEVLYENEGDEELDDVNAAFLQNLVLSQIYKNNANKQAKDYYEQYQNSDYGDSDENNFDRWDSLPVYDKQQSYFDDEDVHELKQLARSEKENNGPTTQERLRVFANDGNKNSFGKSHKGKNKRGIINTKQNEYFSLSDKSRELTLPKINVVSTTILPKAMVDSPKIQIRGQKEEMLIRPATPAKHMFSKSVTQLTKNEPERKHELSVFDTIKHMLDMEKNLEKNRHTDEILAPKEKRIVSSEDSLTQQLSVLKKSL